MSEITVIGLGNADCGDDGIGPLVARLLAARAIAADVRTRAGDMLALIEDWAHCETVILIDAAQRVTSAGCIHRLDLDQDELPRDLSLSSTHAFGLIEAAELAKALGQRPRHLIVYAVEGSRFEPGAAMSGEVEAAAACVAAQIALEVARFTAGKEQAHA